MLVVERQAAQTPSRHAPHTTPESLLEFLREFANGLAATASGPTSADLLKFFSKHAALIPHHDGAQPQEGHGSLRSYLRRHAGLFTGAAVRLDEVRMIRDNAAIIKAAVHTKHGQLSAIVHARFDDNQGVAQQWSIGHLWLRPLETAIDPQGKGPRQLGSFSGAA